MRGLGLVLLALIFLAPCARANESDWAVCNTSSGMSAVRACTRIIEGGQETQADLATAYNQRGVAYYSLKQYDLAIADYDTSIARNPPRMGVSYINRGLALTAKGENEGAIADFDRAIQFEPTNAGAYSGRCDAYNNEKDYDRAIADCSIALQLGPDEIIYGIRGDAYHSKKDYDRAIADYSQALRINPRSVFALRGRAIVFQSKGNPKQAVSDLTQALRIEPNDPVAHKFRGDLLSGNGQYDAAIADYDQAIRFKPGLTSTWNNRSVAHLKKGEYDLAVADANQAIALDAHFATAYLNRGLAYQAKGEIERAKADFIAASTMPPTESDASDTPQVAREQLGALENEQKKAQASEPKLVTETENIRPAPAATALPAAPFDPGKRIALIIGNSAYRGVNPLRNPDNDAHAVAEQFRRLGFAEVTEKHDLALNELSAVLNSFGDRAQDADWAVVYYAGHGLEVGGVNYIIPVDAALATAAHVEEEAIPLDRVLSKVEGAHKLRLVILDACRDNPFARRLADASGTRSVGRGLGRVEPTGGILVAYSARDGQVAQDGNGANSPFALALVKHLEEPGVEISLLFRKVRDTVFTGTRGQQEPFTYGSLPAEALFFKSAAQ
jgi:tetratricopeptide (TPR) repeat protein